MIVAQSVASDPFQTYLSQPQHNAWQYGQGGIQGYGGYGDEPLLPSYSSDGIDSFSNRSSLFGGGMQSYDNGYYPFAMNPGYGAVDTTPDDFMQEPVQYQAPLTTQSVIAKIQSIAPDIDGLSDGKKDGNISAQDLRKVLEDQSGKFTQDQKDAADFLLENKNGLRGRLDFVDGKVDGLFTQDSLNQLMANPGYEPPPPPKLSNTQALTRVRDELKNRLQSQVPPFFGSSFAEDHILIGRENIVALANDSNASPEAKAAAQHILDNPALMDKIARCDDGDSDTRFYVNEITRVINMSDVESIGAN